MEAIGAAASILAIAGAGIQISLKLIAFADQVGTAPKRIQDVGTDVSVTAGTLQELGELMNKIPTRKSAAMFNPDQVRNILASSIKCREIFDELKDILGKASQQLRDVYKSSTKSHDLSPKIKLSKLERMKWPFLRPSMEPLRSALRDAKSTLSLILQVVHLRHAHTTASLGREEQNDLIRMIAAMRRQQLASEHGDEGGCRGLDMCETDDSDSEDSSGFRTVLEAWSITPNTLSDETFDRFLITAIPVSQQQIAQLLKTSPQEFREVASMIDDLLFSERDAILGKIVNKRHYRSGDSSIRSIHSQTWIGSHDLFGKVTGRKFKLVVERRIPISTSSQTNMKHRAPRAAHRERDEVHFVPEPERDHCRHDHNPRMHDGSSDSDSIHETGSHTYESSSSVPRREHRRRRPARASSPLMSSSERERRQRRRPNRASPKPSFERRRPFSENDWKRKEEKEEEKKRRETEMLRKAQVEKEEAGDLHEWESPDSQPWTEPQPASKSSDNEIVRSLLAQYTNFERGEPLVQGVATPPPTYDETFVTPRRVPRPY